MRRGIGRLGAYLSLAMIVLLGSGCDDRDRTNPLDPGNAETGGTPDWLRATAGNGVVTLAWESAPPGGFAAFELFRRRDEGIFSLVHRVEDPAAGTLRDATVENAGAYTYRLEVVLEGDTRVVLPEKRAMPGSAVPWVVESGGFGLLLFTPDGRSVRVRTGTGGGHFDIDATSDGSSVWAADYFGDRVQRFDDTGELVTSIVIARPFRVAADDARGVVWAASWRLGEDPTLIAFDFEGDELGRYRLRGEARDVVVDARTGACYVALGRGEGVARAALGDTLRTSATGATIMVLALGDGPRLYGGDPLAGGVFGYDLDSLSVEVSAPAIASPQSMTWDGTCLWVVEDRDRILCLDRDLTTLSELEGVGLATGIAVDAETGTLWLALPEEDRVLRMTTAGEVTTRIGLFQPFGVSIGRAPTAGGGGAPDRPRRLTRPRQPD